MKPPKRADIESRLERLMGQPLWGAGRTLNLISLQLGERVSRTRRDGRTVVVGRQALHLQCAWRILAGGELVVGSGDRLIPRDGSDDPDFDPGEPGSTLCDARLEALFEAHAAEPLVVGAAVVGEGGAFRLELGQGHALEVFPDGSDECWRHLDDGDHFTYPPS